MSGSIGEAYILVRASTEGFQKDLQSGVSGGIKSTATSAAKLFAGAFAAQKIFDVAGGIISSVEDLNSAQAQTQAVLKSTGGAANISAKGVRDLANSIEGYSSIDDVAVQKGENMLLTFKNIRNEQGKGNDVFNQTTKAVADMATSMNSGAIPSGEQMKNTSILVGKALNDPIKGLSALSRVGVSFTAQQKAQIKTMVASGNTMGAQKVILKELNGEFGGAAKAAGGTLNGQITKLKDTFSDFARDLAIKLLPIILKLVSWLNKELPVAIAYLTSVWVAHRAQVQHVIDLITQVVQKNLPQIKQTIENVWKVIAAVTKVVWPLIENEVRTAINIIGDVIHIVMDLIQGRWGAAWGRIKALVKDAFTGIVNNLKIMLGILGNLAKQIGLAILHAMENQLNNLLSWVKKQFNNLISFIGSLPGRAAAAAGRIGTAIVHGLINGLGSLVSAVGKKFSQLPSFLSGLAGRAQGWAGKIGQAIMHGIADGIGGLAGWLESKIEDMASGLLHKAMDILHINSPSLVFSKMVGEPIAEGIAHGILNGTPFMHKAIEGILPQSGGYGQVAMATPSISMPSTRRGFAGTPSGAGVTIHEMNVITQAQDAYGIMRDAETALVRRLKVRGA